MRLIMPRLNPYLGGQLAAQKVKSVFEKIDAEVKLYHYKVRHYEPHVVFAFERGPFLVKTVENGDELEQCLKLRFQVFHKEYMNKNRNLGVDLDRLDEICDHLMIIDRRAGRVIGTYRLNSSLHTDTFYSASEFDLGMIPQLPGNKLELGRACISRDHRTGVVISLLWRGIAEYVRQTKTSVMFGCSSIKTMDPIEIGRTYKYLLDMGHITGDWQVQPSKKYRIRPLAKVMEYLDANPHECMSQDEETGIPALFSSYLRMGAKLCGEPALDRDFRCIDFLTIIKMDEMNPTIRAKYGI